MFLHALLLVRRLPAAAQRGRAMRRPQVSQPRAHQRRVVRRGCAHSPAAAAQPRGLDQAKVGVQEAGLAPRAPRL